MANHLEYPTQSTNMVNRFRPSLIPLPPFQHSLAASTPYIFETAQTVPSVSSPLRSAQSVSCQNIYSLNSVSMHPWPSNDLSLYNDSEVGNRTASFSYPVSNENQQITSLQSSAEQSGDIYFTLSNLTNNDTKSISETSTLPDSILPAMNSLAVSMPTIKSLDVSQTQICEAENTRESIDTAECAIQNAETENFINERDLLTCVNNKRVNTPNRTKSYKCKQCDFTCRVKEDFWNHQRIHIRPDKLLECPRCSFITEYKHHLEYHLRNHIGSKPFKCIKCHYSCVNLSMLRSHMKSHLRPSQYRCNNCPFVSRTFSGLQVHTERTNHLPANEAVSLALQRNQMRRFLQSHNGDKGFFKNLHIAENLNKDVINLSLFGNDHQNQLSLSTIDQLFNKRLLATNCNIDDNKSVVSTPSDICSTIANQELTSSTIIKDTVPVKDVAEKEEEKPLYLSVIKEQLPNSENIVSNDCVDQSQSYNDIEENQTLNTIQLSEEDPLTAMEIESVKANINAHLRCGVCEYLASSRHAMNMHLLYHASLNSKKSKQIVLTSISQQPSNIIDEQHKCQNSIPMAKSEHDNGLDESLPVGVLSIAGISEDLKPKRRRKGKAQRILSANDINSKYLPNPLDLRTTCSINVESGLPTQQLGNNDLKISNFLKLDNQNESWSADIVKSIENCKDNEQYIIKSRQSPINTQSQLSQQFFGRLFECSLCGILFRNFAMYCTHKMFHTPNEPFRCNQCGQLYGERVEFFVHVAQEAHELK